MMAPTVVWRMTLCHILNKDSLVSPKYIVYLKYDMTVQSCIVYLYLYNTTGIKKCNIWYNKNLFCNMCLGDFIWKFNMDYIA